MFVGSFEISTNVIAKHKNMLELSGLFVYMGDLLIFSVLGER